MGLFAVLVPRSDWQRQQNLVFDEPDHIEIGLDFEGIHFIVFEFIVGDFLPGAYRLQHRFQRQIPTHALKTTLTTQLKATTSHKPQSRPSLFIERAIDAVIHLTLGTRDNISQTLKRSDPDLPTQATGLGSEAKGVGNYNRLNVLMRHKRRMILFFRAGCQRLQAFTASAARTAHPARSSNTLIRRTP